MKVHYKAKVYLRDEFVGNLVRLPDSKGFRFTYDKTYLDNGGTGISMSLPVSYLQIDSMPLHAFFSGLCSEGWWRETQCNDQGIARDDEFTLLAANGQDLAGAITVFPDD